MHGQRQDNSRCNLFYKPTLRFLDRTNLVVTALTAFTVLYTRSAGVAYFSAGALACAMSVKAIKPFFRQTRPAQTTQRKQKQTYGMPSTHSATITFYGTYIPLACAWLPSHPSFPQTSLFRPLVLLVVVPWAFAIAGSRVWLGHHTVPQVAVGCAYGFAFSCVWFWLWTHGLGVNHGATHASALWEK
ncbi:hypothetical protein B0F90DRAFT_1807153 [Multifurca ochricompacta]|uniref:Phosphatidic acid phosphatase type 2/haloperoxidase domain-containing protein n=1 Tax=Multifurca ochricompacta TaxID=376703 RepID=A0AAD4MCB3_9AGAM|nr:hypothetical protein B0F90DRAFT_1807153 [Multifurca ochricompacta]